MGEVVLRTTPKAAAVLRQGSLPMASASGPKLGTRREVSAAIARAGLRRANERRMRILLLPTTGGAARKIGTCVASVGALVAPATASLRQVVPTCQEGPQVVAGVLGRAAATSVPSLERRQASVGRVARKDAGARLVMQATGVPTAALEETAPGVTEVTRLQILGLTLLPTLLVPSPLHLPMVTSRGAVVIARTPKALQDARVPRPSHVEEAPVPEVVRRLGRAVAPLETALPLEAVVGLGAPVRVRVSVAAKARVLPMVRAVTLRGAPAKVAVEAAKVDSAKAEFNLFYSCIIDTDKHLYSAVGARRRSEDIGSSSSSERAEVSSETTQGTGSSRRH